MKIPDLCPTEFCGLSNDIAAAAAKKTNFRMYVGPTESFQSLDLGSN